MTERIFNHIGKGDKLYAVLPGANDPVEVKVAQRSGESLGLVVGKSKCIISAQRYQIEEQGELGLLKFVAHEPNPISEYAKLEASQIKPGDYY